MRTKLNHYSGKKLYEVIYENAENSEKIIRKFLLDSSNVVMFANVPTLVINKSKFKKPRLFGHERDPEFIKFLKKIKKDFIKKIYKDRNCHMSKYGGCQDSYHGYHYYYSLSKEIKDMVNKETLIPYNSINRPVRNIRKQFYHFEDPTFFKDNKLVGYVITHEPEFKLFLTLHEKQTLEKNDVVFKIEN